MKIINSIKKIFHNNEEKYDFSTTSIDNVIDKNTQKYLDEELRDIKLQIKQLNRYVTPIEIPLEIDSKFRSDLLKCYRIGDLLIVSGTITTTQRLSNNELYKVCDIPYRVNTQARQCFLNTLENTELGSFSAQVVCQPNGDTNTLSIYVMYAGNQYTDYKDNGICAVFKLGDVLSSPNN